jgi:hypothetical protein
MPLLDELAVPPSCGAGRYAWLDAEDTVCVIEGSVHPGYTPRVMKEAERSGPGGLSPAEIGF